MITNSAARPRAELRPTSFGSTRVDSRRTTSAHGASACATPRTQYSSLNPSSRSYRREIARTTDRLEIV